MKNDNQKIDVMKGVVKPDILKEQIRACVAGDRNARSYLIGAHKYLTVFPLNPYIVPVLRRAMERYNENLVL